MQHHENNNEVDLYRIVLFSSCSDRVLVIPDNGRLLLPSISVPRYQRPAEHLTASLESKWAQRAICLFGLEARQSAGLRYHVMQSCEQGLRCTAGSLWASPSSILESQFHEATDYAAVMDAVCQCQEPAGDQRAFARLNWFSEVTAWVGKVAAPQGLTLSGNFSQFNAGPAFSLVRFETCGSALWFKAVGEPNLREFPITLALSNYFPVFLPSILAFREDWNAWLAIEAEGEHPGETSPFDVWRTVAVTLADLQIASMGRTLHLADLGCHDTRPFALSELVQPFLESMAELMAQQTKSLPLPLSRDELNSLTSQLQEILSDATDLEIPNSIGHLDFNPGNIVVSPDRCVFLDWAEASIGHPFITFEYLLEHFRRCRGSDDFALSALTKTYADQWRPFLSPCQIERAMILAPVLAVLAYAVSSNAWRQPSCLPEIARHLRSLTRRLKREADRWVSARIRGESPCVN